MGVWGPSVMKEMAVMGTRGRFTENVLLNPQRGKLKNENKH